MIISGDDDTPNECGGEEQLVFEGEAMSPMESCGDCGVLVCDGENELVCEDPGTNACDGCAELEAQPGDDCTDEDGDPGQFACDGEEADSLICQVGDVNACGGTEPLDHTPGDSCGPCELDTYQCVGSNDIECDEQVGCPEATDVAATQGEHSDAVVVSWRGSTWAQGYRIYREGNQIAEVSPGSLTYRDETAEPAGAPDQIDVTASDDETDGVHLDWELGESDYVEHYYQVEIVFPEATSELSETVTGYRDLDVQRFEMSVDGGGWTSIGDEPGHVHEEADKASVDSATPDVADTGYDFVELTASPEIQEPDEHDYELRVVTTDGEESETAEATGQRAWGEPGYTWSVSDDQDGDFAQLEDCTDSTSCTDEFPIDEDIAEKYYKLTVDGDGIEETTGDAVHAEVELLEVVPEDFDTPVMVGETTEFAVQLQSADGESVAREGAVLDVEVSPEGAVDNGDFDAVTTDSDGRASIELQFDHEIDDAQIEWQPDDSRVSEESAVHGPFDVESTDASAAETTITEVDRGELLADGEEEAWLEIEVRDDDGEPIGGAALEGQIDSDSVDLDCDSHTDHEDGLAQCTITADEPDRYTFELQQPVELSHEDIAFYAEADDYPGFSAGELLDVAVVGDRAVFAGENLDVDNGTADVQASVVVDRVTGQPEGALDAEFTRIDALAADGDELFALGDQKVARYELDDGNFDEKDTNDEDHGGDLMILEGDYVVLLDSDSVEAVALQREGLDYVDSNDSLDIFDDAQLFAARGADGKVVALGEGIGDPQDVTDPLTDPFTEYHFISFTVPQLDEEPYLESDDVSGQIDFFEFGGDSGTEHFIAGDFDIGDDASDLARLDDDGEVVDAFDPEVVPDTAGGLWYHDGLLFSAGVFEQLITPMVTIGGQAYDAETGDLEEDYGLDNEAARGEITAAPRHLIMIDEVGDDSGDLYEIVDRPDVDPSNIEQ